MKKISILGSTGSIGVNALNVIDHLGDDYIVTALSANKNGKRLIEQAKKYHPASIAIVDKDSAQFVKTELKESGIKIFTGR